MRLFFMAVMFSFLFSFLAHAAPIRLALNWKAEPQFGGFYEAQEKGFYKKLGLDVVVQEGGAGTPVVQMIASGKTEFGIVSADEIVVSRANGSDIEALFAVYQTNPQGIMVHAERGFKSIGDVFTSDGVLAIQSGLPYAEFLKKKFSGAKVRIVPYTGGISLFLNDPKLSQQCFVTSEPLAAKKSKADVKTFLVAEAGYNPYTTVLAVRKSYREKNPSVVKSMVNAVREGWAGYYANPDSTNAVMAKINKAMDLETFKASALAQKPLIVTDTVKLPQIGAMTVDRWSELITQLKDLKVIKKDVTAKDMMF